MKKKKLQFRSRKQTISLHLPESLLLLTDLLVEQNGLSRNSVIVLAIKELLINRGWKLHIQDEVDADYLRG